MIGRVSNLPRTLPLSREAEKEEEGEEDLFRLPVLDDLFHDVVGEVFGGGR